MIETRIFLQRETVEILKKSLHIFDAVGVRGCTKLLRELNDRSVGINEYKLRRIMRENGLYSVVVKKFKPYRPGKSDGMYAQNLLQRNFAPFGLNQYWCGDITYIRTNLGWVYLAVVNRGKHENLVFHSDRGTQYSSRGYRNMLNDFGIEPSMSAPGCPYDNAAIESFFASLKKEFFASRESQEQIHLFL